MSEKEYIQKFEAAINHLRHEMTQLRTSRATPSLVENISVNAYGADSPLVQLATITTPDARTIAIQPWDKNIVHDIEKALQKSEIGIQPTVTTDLIRLIMPPMTEERRKEVVRTAHEKAEETKVRIKQIRETFLKEWKEMKKDSTMSEDDFNAKQKHLQEKVQMYNDLIKTTVEQKEQEIMTI